MVLGGHWAHHLPTLLAFWLKATFLSANISLSLSLLSFEQWAASWTWYGSAFIIIVSNWVAFFFFFWFLVLFVGWFTNYWFLCNLWLTKTSFNKVTNVSLYRRHSHTGNSQGLVMSFGAFKKEITKKAMHVFQLKSHKTEMNKEKWITSLLPFFCPRYPTITAWTYLYKIYTHYSRGTEARSALYITFQSILSQSIMAAS